MKLISALEAPKNAPSPTPSAPKDFSQAGLNIIQAIEDPTLFGPLFKDQQTWASWKIFLKGLFGLEMKEEEAEFFRQHTGRKIIPASQASECFCIAGRRGGKSFVSAIIAGYLAAFKDWSPFLSQGEVGWIFIVSPDRNQSRVVLGYIKSIFRLEPFAPLVEKELATELRLKNGITIEVRTASFRSVRGYTILSAILDEVAFLRSEESATPDTELVTALLPALSTTPGSLLLAISTPYMKAGVLWQAYKEFFGKEEEETPLIWKADTQTMNPSFRESAIKQLFVRDKIAARAEYLGDFREDVVSYMPVELIEAITIPGRIMLPPQESRYYSAFVDVSGGKQDSFSLGICHKEGELILLDRVEEVRAPVPKPQDVIQSFSEILHAYRVNEVVGDAYGGNVYSAEFKKYGLRYIESKLDKSEIFLRFQAVCSMHRVELLDLERLRVQLQQLERRTRAGGKDSVGHPDKSGFHDDIANCAAGAVVLAFSQRTWSVEEMEARLPTPIKNERAEEILSGMRGEDYRRKKAAAEAAREMDEWMRGGGGSRIVK